MKMTEIQKKLFYKQDLDYKNFTTPLNPTVDKSTIIGVRIPEIRKIAKEITDAENFLNCLPHQYFEEYLLHRFIIENETNFEKTISNLDLFLKYANSWSIVDGFKNKTFVANKKQLFNKILQWLKSDHIYTVRFAINLLSNYFLGPPSENIINLVGNINCKNEYYLQMMVAWFLQTSFAKDFELTFSCFKKLNLDRFTFNKTISKCMDSFKINNSQKEILRKYKKERL